MFVDASQVDDLLLPFLKETDERAEEALLSGLIAEHVEPTVKKVLAYKLRSYVNGAVGGFRNPDAEEVYHDIHVLLLRRLRDLKGTPSGRPISNLRSYVATMARNACDEYLRRKYPQRRYLKDKIRYHLTTRDEFDVWEDGEGGWLSGLKVWRRERAPQTGTDFPGELDSCFEHTDARRLKLHELLAQVFRASGRPLDLEVLTAFVARALGVEDKPFESFDEGERPLSEHLINAAAGPDVLMEYRQLLERLWHEIRQLPRRQRVVLLLNLRNPRGVNVITLLPATRVANVEQIAEALEMPPEQFERFWPELPMDDLRIAEYLGATRQQVINLRKNARDRLARRMREHERR